MKMTITTMDYTNDLDVEILENVFSAIRREWNELPETLKEYIKTVEVEQKTLRNPLVVTVKITGYRTVMNGFVEWTNETNLNNLEKEDGGYELTRRIFSARVRGLLSHMAESLEIHTATLKEAIKKAPKKVYPAIF